jgi:hypothetical protein
VKHFNEEFDFFLNKIKEHESFSLVRFHDGEWYIISKRFIDIRQKCHGEWKYDPDNVGDNYLRDCFIDALQYKDDNYYVGIMTNCHCLKDFKHGGHELLRDLSGQSDSNLTFASVFMNKNYLRAQNEIIPLLKDNKIILIAHSEANVKNLPFVPEVFFSIRGNNAWKSQYGVIDTVKKYLKETNPIGYMFLVCCGPLSEMLIHQLHGVNNKNTYIDFGSTLDEYMFSEGSRWFHRGIADSNVRSMLLHHECVWN